MNVASLPVQLYCPIVHYIDQRGDLAALALTSRTWQLEAERRLYHEIFLSDSIHTYDLTEGSHPQRIGDVHSASLGPLKLKVGMGRILSPEETRSEILQRFVSFPRLASYVRSFSVILHPNICDRVHDALAVMFNLKRLFIQHPSGHALYQPLAVVANGARFKLEYLNFRSHTQLEEMDALFLGAHNELRELEWGHMISTPGSKPDAALDVQLPLLRTLTLRDRATLASRSVLLQQTVTNLRMSGLNVIEAGDVYMSVQSLKLFTLFEDIHAMHFPNLVYLWLKLFSGLEPIRLLPRLQKLSTVSSDRPRVPSFKECHTCAMTFFIANPSLKQVEVRKSKAGSGFVFSRDGSDALPTSKFDTDEWRFW